MQRNGWQKFALCCHTGRKNALFRQNWMDSFGYLQACLEENDASPLGAALADAVRTGMTERYAALRAQVADLAEIAPAALELRRLRARLAEAAPLWTQMILVDPAAAADPATMSRAWQWRQMETWLTQISAGASPRELQAQLKSLSEERRRTIADLVGHRAWRRLADNLGDRERRALKQLSGCGEPVRQDRWEICGALDRRDAASTR